MRPDHHARGGASVAVLNSFEAWESNLVMNLRLWCEGPAGQAQVWNEFATKFPKGSAQEEMQAFETLLNTLIQHAMRPLVRHSVACSCVGSDECIFLNLVRTAADGHLTDAALISTLIVGPAHAEHIAILAGQVGASARHLVQERSGVPHNSTANVIRLH